MIKGKLCLIFNAAPKYREAIYSLIDEEYDCDWYFGPTHSGIKEMDFNILKNVNHYKIWGNPQASYWQRGIISLLFRRKYNVFLMTAESRSITDYLFFLIARILGKRVYVWTHGWYGKETRYEAAIKHWMFNQVTGIFVYGNYARNLMVDNGIDPKKIYTIHNSLDHEKQLQIREHIQKSDIYKEHFKNEYPTIIFIGRLTLVKKLGMLVQALADLRNKGKYYNLIFVGDGPEKSHLIELALKFGLSDNIWFYGSCYDEDENAKLIYNADVCVSPGNVGLTAIHVMTFGCPVITHNSFKLQMPEFEAITPGRTGDFFTIDDVGSLMDTISLWFVNNVHRREAIRQYCYDEIDNNWTPEFQMKVIRENLYNA